MSSIVTKRFIKCHDHLLQQKRVRSSRQFALSLEYLPQSLSEVKKGRRDVTIELLRKAVETYHINPVYLYTGEGPMFMTEEDLSHLRVLTIVTDHEEEERIVHVPVPAQAGYPDELANPQFIRELPTYSLPDYKFRVGTHRSFDVAGDSMEPTLMEGDKVVCSFLEPTLWETALKDHYIYVIVTRGDVVVKRVQNRLKEDKILLLSSDNDFYDSYRVSIGNIREIWYVRARVSPFLPAPGSVKDNLLEELRELKQTIRQQSQYIRNLSQTVENLLVERAEKE